ncbi:hypothetical protein ACWS7L_16200 [Exiguobacterium artemiae]
MSSRTVPLVFRLLLAGLILVNLLNTTVLDLPRLTLVTNILLVLVEFFFFVRLLKNYQIELPPPTLCSEVEDS